nr:hypothetical protein [Sphingomonas laterariae]
MILVQRVTQLRHVNIKAAIGVAGKLVQVVADAVQRSHELNKGAMLYGAAAARAGASFVKSGSTGKCANSKASARSPFFISRVFVVRHTERNDARPLPLVTSSRHPPSCNEGFQGTALVGSRPEMPAGGSGVATP